MTLPGRPVPDPRRDARRVAQRDPLGVPAAGEAVPPRRGRRPRAAPVPRDPGGLRAARRRRGAAAPGDRRRGIGGTARLGGLARRSRAGPGVARGVAGASRRRRRRPVAPRAPGGARAGGGHRPAGRRRRAEGVAAARAAHAPRLRARRRRARRPTTRPPRRRSTPSGRAAPGTARRRRRTGRSTRASTPTRASTGPSTWRVPAARPQQDRRTRRRPDGRPAPASAPRAGEPAAGADAELGLQRQRVDDHGRRRRAGGRTAWAYEEADAAGRAARRGAAARRGLGRRHRRSDAAAEPLPDLEAVARRAAPAEPARARAPAGPPLAAARRPDRAGRRSGTGSARCSRRRPAAPSSPPTCPEPLPLLSLAVQPLVIAALFAVPPAAAVGAFATLVALAVARAGRDRAVGEPRPERRASGPRSSASP